MSACPQGQRARPVSITNCVSGAAGAQQKQRNRRRHQKQIRTYKNSWERNGNSFLPNIRFLWSPFTPGCAMQAADLKRNRGEQMTAARDMVRRSPPGWRSCIEIVPFELTCTLASTQLDTQFTCACLHPGATVGEVQASKSALERRGKGY